MDVLNYLASNIPLYSICAIMFFIAFRNLRLRRKESIYFIVFTAIVLLLSVVVFMERYAQFYGNVVLGTVFTSLGYILRPVLLFIFVLLANMERKRKLWWYLTFGLLLAVNAIIYAFPLFFNVPALSKLVFYYVVNADGTASFVRGGFLNFCSHAICLVYLGLLVYVSTVRFHGKHRRDGLVLILCVFIILTTVTVEMLADRSDLLNIVCEICLMINYIFIMSVNSSRDPLTDLYDRRAYYEDVSRYKEQVNGIIEIDMNELKYLNDNFGHEAGDAALRALAKIFTKSIDSASMCVYRLSGDEFVILMFSGNEAKLNEVAARIKEKLSASSYSAALGVFYFDRKKQTLTYEEAVKKAEELMYVDKERYYQETMHQRRGK